MDTNCSNYCPWSRSQNQLISRAFLNPTLPCHFTFCRVQIFREDINYFSITVIVLKGNSSWSKWAFFPFWCFLWLLPEFTIRTFEVLWFTVYFLLFLLFWFAICLSFNHHLNQNQSCLKLACSSTDWLYAVISSFSHTFH